MKTISTLLFFAIGFSAQIKADLIANGNFNNCSFDSWSTEKDYLYNGSSPDFEIIDDGQNCYGEISIEKGSSGASQNVRLFQEISNIGDLNYISFDYWLNIEDSATNINGSLVPDNFWIALTNGASRYDADGNNGSFLVGKSNIIANSSKQTFETNVIGNFDPNQSWFIEFVINKGYIDNQFIGTQQSDDLWSSLSIDNVRLTAVNEPSNLTLFALALVFCFARVKKTKLLTTIT